MSAPAVQHAQASGAALPQAAPPSPGKNRTTLYHLDVRQQPRQARMAGSGEKADRRPIDPPPIIRLRTRKAHARKKPEHLLTDNDLVTPTLTHTLFMFASLVPENSEEELFEAHGSKNALVAGSVVSSLFHLKDSSCFVFPDMSIRVEGRWRFKMSLYEVHEDGVEFCAAILTDVFQVYSSKRFPGMGKSTELSKSFAQQGLKLRIRRPGQKNEDEDDSDTVQPAQTKPTPRRRAPSGPPDGFAAPSSRRVSAPIAIGPAPLPAPAGPPATGSRPWTSWDASSPFTAVRTHAPPARAYPPPISHHAYLHSQASLHALDTRRLAPTTFEPSPSSAYTPSPSSAGPQRTISGLYRHHSHPYAYPYTADAGSAALSHPHSHAHMRTSPQFPPPPQFHHHARGRSPSPPPTLAPIRNIPPPPARTRQSPPFPAPPASLEMSHSRSQGPHDPHNSRTGTSPRLALGPAARRFSPPSATSALLGAAASPRMQGAESSLRSTNSPASASGLSTSAAEDASSSGVAQAHGQDVEMHSATESSPPTPAEGGLPISAGGSRASLSMLLGEGCSSAKEVDGGDDGVIFM
ncbi:uncharacterized protein JCM10292_004037 [Rhodotorula paludigena]|uniref:uncharacterized protein n=1 Tax=Rhodotorula paludigena TaxID=86838 RepID=UPI00316C0FE7